MTLVAAGKIGPTNRAADQVYHHLIGLTPSTDLPGEDLALMMPDSTGLPSAGRRRARRPKLPASIRLAVYERDRYTCRHCGWSPGKPDGYRGHHPITVVVGTERRVDHIIRSWTDKPDQVFYRDHDIVIALEVDHIHPLVAGGAFRDLDNLQSLCSRCNNRKGATV